MLPGPFATQLLADAGADVIKIEDTDRGDYARHMPPYTDDGVGTIFDAVNRGKRSVAVDLKTEPGREAFMRLVETADVVFEQFRPGVVDRLGIDYESVHEHNSEVVYCSLSGFGQTGPHADRVGHDLNYVGMAGLLDLTRADEATDPQIPGYPIGDMAGGLFAAFSILGALLSRELGNADGEYVDVAMTDVVASFSQAVAHEALTGDGPRPGETPLTGAAPWYGVYETADGRYVTIAAIEEKFWREFCEAVDREDLLDAHMTTDPAERAALREELTDLFAEKTRDEWEAELGDVDAMVAPVWTLGEALSSEHATARELIDRDTGAPRVGFPAQVSEPPAETGGPAPEHGEHTDTVLQSVGFDAADIQSLSEGGVVR
ncbi:CaiB/BaiF CoA-transferase family protein [Halococcus dombrowskii]|uniref:CaiB/BaiF CoA-transferase family protein n=1 Tax=Halococcus dombrowskii TaxID=179637 RepID=A0AAV3SFV4_HALDO